MGIRRFIGDKPFYRRVFAVMVPVLIQQVITNFVGLLDNLMVGQIGTEPMSGVAIVNQLLFVFALCIFGALVGAFITERVYVVPGIGGLLINAINAYDNGVIVGVTLFYAVISVASMILGDLLISLVDPRISFTSKAR